MQSLLSIKPIRIDEAPPEAEVGLIAAFMTVAKRDFWDRITRKSKRNLSLEVFSANQQTGFVLGVPHGLESYFSSQLLSHHSQLFVQKNAPDPLHLMSQMPYVVMAELNLVAGSTLPIKTSTKQEDIPLFGSVLGYLAKVPMGEAAYIQWIIRTTSQSGWSSHVRSRMFTTDSEGKQIASTYKTLMEEKLKAPLVEVQARILYGAKDEATSTDKLTELAGSFGVYSLAEGNGLFWHKKAINEKNWHHIAHRQFGFWDPTMVLNLNEVVSLWHVPGKSLAHITSISWGRTLVSEAPDNLPVAENMTEEEKQHVNFFAKTGWRNHEAVMGLSREDRTKHTYIIGKTGAGKSTLIANLAINDIRNGEGVAIIDPHGDLTEMILDYIPKRRMNDVVYLDPTISDTRAFSLNMFDTSASHTDVVASGIVSVFYKLYGYSWGPRLEYILRNVILSLLYAGDSTFADIPRILTDAKFRSKVIEKIAPMDPILREFWVNEFEKMNDKLRTDAISPVLNKVGQFLSSQRIRNVVGYKRSTINLEEIMDQGKILLLNLSQGKLGEDTTALLGAMFITKIQLAAMQRVNRPSSDRKDFYLYVDEFQNFATQSFTKILSEARKYRLNLIMANQYTAQVPEEVQRAIFGNIGTMISFVVGASDANVLAKEFGGVYTPEDIVALGKFEILMKMAINGLTSAPFAATTLPLPSVINGNKEKIIANSIERYYQKVG